MKEWLLQLIRLYQALPRPHSCRFVPSCSEFAYRAINKYGIVRGSLLGIRRIFKCHPWAKGAVEDVV